MPLDLYRNGRLIMSGADCSDVATEVIFISAASDPAMIGVGMLALTRISSIGRYEQGFRPTPYDVDENTLFQILRSQGLLRNCR